MRVALKVTIGFAAVLAVCVVFLLLLPRFASPGAGQGAACRGHIRKDRPQGRGRQDGYVLCSAPLDYPDRRNDFRQSRRLFRIALGLPPGPAALCGPNTPGPHGRQRSRHPPANARAIEGRPSPPAFLPKDPRGRGDADRLPGARPRSRPCRVGRERPAHAPRWKRTGLPVRRYRREPEPRKGTRRRHGYLYIEHLERRLPEGLARAGWVQGAGKSGGRAPHSRPRGPTTLSAGPAANRGCAGGHQPQGTGAGGARPFGRGGWPSRSCNAAENQWRFHVAAGAPQGCFSKGG